eukprot:4383864-Pyramimonas_sp.AAC.1
MTFCAMGQGRHARGGIREFSGGRLDVSKLTWFLVDAKLTTRAPAARAGSPAWSTIERLPTCARSEPFEVADCISKST